MKAYVKANVDVPNSYNSNKNNGDDDITIIQDVHDDERRISSQTTYDTLIKNYVTDSTAANDNSIDLKQCEDIIKIFSSPADKSADYAEYEKLVDAYLERKKEGRGFNHV